MKKLAILFTLMLSIVVNAHADYQQAAILYIGKNYDEAYNMLVPLAENSNDAQSQYLLGMMYLRGQGTEQDYEEAGKWFRKASMQAHAAAQYKLARLYSEGNGVPLDNEFAYIWYSVGATHQHKKSMDAIADARSLLSEEELLAAEKVLPDYIKKFGPQEDESTKGKYIGDPNAN